MECQSTSQFRLYKSLQVLFAHADVPSSIYYPPGPCPRSSLKYLHLFGLEVAVSHLLILESYFIFGLQIRQPPSKHQITTGLSYRSGMLQSWNKFCFSSGYINVTRTGREHPGLCECRVIFFVALQLWMADTRWASYVCGVGGVTLVFLPSIFSSFFYSMIGFVYWCRKASRSHAVRCRGGGWNCINGIHLRAGFHLVTLFASGPW